MRQFRLPGSASKPLAIFDGCGAHLGCTILLRGDDDVTVLRAVKAVLRAAAYFSHALRLEVGLAYMCGRALCLVPCVCFCRIVVGPRQPHVQVSSLLLAFYKCSHPQPSKDTYIRPFLSPSRSRSVIAPWVCV